MATRAFSDRFDGADKRRGRACARETRGSSLIRQSRARRCERELVRDCGRFLELGQYCDCGPQPLNPHLLVRKELHMAGVYGSEPRHWIRALKFLEARANRYPFADLVTHRLGLDRVNEALDLVASWKTGKVVIAP